MTNDDPQEQVTPEAPRYVTPKFPTLKIRPGENSKSIFRRALSTLDRAGAKSTVRDLREAVNPDDMEDVVRTLTHYFSLEYSA